MSFKNSIIWLYFSSPKNFYPLAGKLIPLFWALAAVLTAIGLYIGFIVAPSDYQQLPTISKARATESFLFTCRRHGCPCSFTL
jgi:ABC-type transport system involved in cytochrome c biogenesis permease subunit